eukprot:2007835-Amphidinium_carterae.2
MPQGVKRRQERATKLDKKIADLEFQQSTLASQLEAALSQVCADFYSKEQKLRSELAEARRQKELDAGTVHELREKQRQLVPTAATGDLVDSTDTFSQEQYFAFNQVPKALAKRILDCQQVFTEMEKLVTESLLKPPDQTEPEEPA